MDASVDAGAQAPPSCASAGPGLSDCGPNQESCCASLEVPAGRFFRSYDGVTNSGNNNFTSQAYPAAVSGYRLDKYEITVGRFRQFVNAFVAGWTPPAHSGIHTHLSSGQGLINSGAAGTFETGWDSTWTANLATTAAAWTTNLQCASATSTWTALPGASENHPINCETWFEAYAFCIWDGGFLPSETEWNYAASGGSDQRAYPWSSPSTSTTIDCTYANYYSCTGATTPVGTDSPKGDGKWGQADLAGNVYEWTLDWMAPYVTPCVDCAYLTPATARIMKGGDFGAVSWAELTSFRGYQPPTNRYSGYIGARCARTP